jgi:two-component system, OmpR family, sensor histidine kinase KdpD
MMRQVLASFTSFDKRKPIAPKSKQYLIALLLVFFVSSICYLFSSYLGYRVVALILLLVVSVIAVSFDIFPVLIAAFFSALIWNFFFIPPIYHFRISNSEDLILLIMYFLIAMINAVLTYKIRRAEKRAREKEEKANTVKLYNTMLNSLSHELRTPIAAIVGATDNLQSANNNLTPGDKDQLIAEISKAALRLDRQVGNLLDISRLESGFIKAKKTWVDIVETIYDIVHKIEENGINQQIIINIGAGIPLFKTDKVMVEQIVSNIINNAVLYSYPDSIIKISVTDGIQHTLRIMIEDTGPGFPEDELPFIFDKFYRLKNSKAGGTGLGLSIVKGFAEALNGQVMIENVAGGGGRFIIDIPCETSYLKVTNE